MDEREKNLPKWAQELIQTLRLRIQCATEPLVKELGQLRPKVTLLERRVAALEELLKCAGNGGHLTAQAVVEVFESYSLSLAKED